MASLRDVGRRKELAALRGERLRHSGERDPSRTGLNLPCLVVTDQGSSGYKIIEEFLPLPDRDYPQLRVSGATVSLTRIVAQGALG